MNGAENFIPVPKADLCAGLAADERLAPGERERFADVARLLSLAMHYEAFDKREALKEAYAHLDPAEKERTGGDPEGFMRAFEAVLEGANFVEIPAEVVIGGAGKSTLSDLKVRPRKDGVRTARFFYRGAHVETIERRRFWLWRKRLDAEMLDDVILAVELAEDLGRLAKRGRRQVRPGAVLLKHFADVPRADLLSLHPGAEPTMKRFDQLLLGVPAVTMGLPLLVKLAATFSVIAAAVSAWLGIGQASQTAANLTSAVAALSAFVAVGGFLMQQRLKFDRQRLFYQKKLAETVYFHTIANNRGVIDGLINAAEAQDAKEAILAYWSLRAFGPQTRADLDRSCERILAERFGARVDFEIGDALSKLERLGLLARDGETLTAPPTEQALAALDAAWDGFFHYPKANTRAA